MMVTDYEQFGPSIRIKKRRGNDQVPALVHPLNLVLAAGVTGADSLSDRLGDPAALPIVGHRRRWSARCYLDHRHVARCPVAEADGSAFVTQQCGGLTHVKRTTKSQKPGRTTRRAARSS